MSSPIPEHEISRFRLLKDTFIIVEAVLNIIVHATACSKEQLVTSKLCFLNHPNVTHYCMHDNFLSYFFTVLTT